MWVEGFLYPIRCTPRQRRRRRPTTETRPTTAEHIYRVLYSYSNMWKLTRGPGRRDGFAGWLAGYLIAMNVALLFVCISGRGFDPAWSAWSTEECSCIRVYNNFYDQHRTRVRSRFSFNSSSTSSSSTVSSSTFASFGHEHTTTTPSSMMTLVMSFVEDSRAFCRYQYIWIPTVYLIYSQQVMWWIGFE